jgi:hypothetical protein
LNRLQPKLVQVRKQERAKHDYDWAKHDYDWAKHDYDWAKHDYDWAKHDYDWAKHDWAKLKGRSMGSWKWKCSPR